MKERFSVVSCLRKYRERYGLTQDEFASAIQRQALVRGDKVIPGLDQCAISRHENGHKRPSPYYQALYCEVYGATPVDLGFRLALPGENGHHEAVDRREFLAGAAGFAAEAALAGLPLPTRRMSHGDLVRLRQSVVNLYELGNEHGAGAVYALTTRTFHRVRGHAERGSYDAATGQGLRELVGETARHAGSMAFDAGQHADARRWWLEAMHWARLAEADSVGIGAMAAMAHQAAEQRRPREAIDLAAVARRTTRAATPRLTSLLLAREALGHAGAGDATGARASLRRACGLVQTRHDDDPYWLGHYDEADFTCQEHRVAVMLGETVEAEHIARAALALGDPIAYPRNHARNLISLADVLGQRHKIDESAAVALQAAAVAAHVDSGRITRGLHSLARRLAPYKGEPAVGEFLALV